MKLLTIFGTRPEIIRLSLIIKKLDKLCDQILVHTGQNFDINLSDVFIKDLSIRKINYHLGAKGSLGVQVGIILEKIEKIILKEKPDRILILGDTNSALSAIIAKRMGVKVFHMEAGNRCYDDRVPEEVNRRIIDHSSDILMPYTERSRQNLLAEGIPGRKIFVTGNPIKEVLEHYNKEISNSLIMKKFNLAKKDYFLVTLHRQENVDDIDRLAKFVASFNKIVKKYNKKLIWSIHPRTRNKLDKIKNIKLEENIIAIEPLGLIDFVNLEKNAFCVLTDSGTVQEECSIFQVPNTTLRDSTERPETLEAGSNFITGCNTDTIMQGIETAIKTIDTWSPPIEYSRTNVSDIVVKIVLSHWMK